MMEAEVGVMQPPAKDEAKAGPLGLWEEPSSAGTLISDLWPPEPQENKFLF